MPDGLRIVYIVCLYLHFLCSLLHTVIWYQVFLSNTSDSKTDLYNLLIKLLQVLLPRVWVDQKILAMDGYYIIPNYLELEPHHQMQFSVELLEVPVV